MKKIVKKFSAISFRKLDTIRRHLDFSTCLKYWLANLGTNVRVEISGVKLIVRRGTPDLAVAIHCLNGEFEVLRHLLPANYKGNILDAGGYIGTSAIALNKVFPKANIIVIEPSDANIKILKKNVANIDNIKVVHGALVAETTETIALRNLGTGEWGFSIVEQPLDLEATEILHQTPAYTISELIGPDENIGLLKLDIEGGEADIIKRDRKTLNSIPIVFAELHDRIVNGCTDLFLEFSEDRILVKDQGEKYLSISRDKFP